MGVQTETISLYSKDSWKKWFAYWRFLVAPYQLVENLIPKSGTIIELGCGEGLFSNYMALSSKTRKIIGIEIDKWRIKIAQKGITNTKFIHLNALKAKMPKADRIVMFHLLHHLKSFDDQVELISKSLIALNKNGKLVIIEIDKDYTYKYFVTWFWDHFTVPWFFEGHFYQKDIYFRSQKEWETLFKSMKLKCKAIKYDKWMPFSHIVFEVSKV